MTSSGKIISGTGPSNGKAYVTIGTKKYSATVYSGKWKVALSAVLKSGTKIYVKISLGNRSSATKYIYVKPATPTINKVLSTALILKGTAPKGAIVYIKYPGHSYTTKASSSTGVYSYKTGKIKKGTTISVYCKLGGQTSATKTYKVLK